MDLLELGRECVWCDYRQCWVHKQICRWKAFSLGEKKCSGCVQLSLWPKKKPSEKGPRKKNDSRRSSPKAKESDPIEVGRQLLLPWSNADLE